MRSRLPLSFLPLGAAAILTSAASAQAETASIPEEPPTRVARNPLQFKIVAGAYLGRLGGDVTLGPSPLAQDISLDDQFQIDNLEPSVNVELTIRKSYDWDLQLSGFAYSTDGTESFVGGAIFGSLTLNHGDIVHSSFDITTFAAGLSFYPFKPMEFDIAGDMFGQVELRLAPMVGARYIDVDHDVRVIGGGMETAGGEWAAPYVGGRLEIAFDAQQSVPLLESLQLELALVGGPTIGGDGGFMIHLRTGATWYFTDNIGLHFGYQLLHMNSEKDDYEFDGGLAGLFIGASIRF